MSTIVTRWQYLLLWASLILYAEGRVCQQYPELIPVQLIVLMQVAAPAVFAVVHGSILYRVKGMAVFAAFCLGAGALCESLSLRTGFPFGHYAFSGLMGPQVLRLPVLLVLAYLGIGYCSWVLALLILHRRNRVLEDGGVVAVPLLASAIMLAWDASMEPIWSTIDRAWIWRDGGGFYGVPVSNFVGWYFTAYLFYQAFALYCRRKSIMPATVSRNYWRAAIACYGVCAGGNLLIFRTGLFPQSVIDATGRRWITMDILTACVIVSLCVMTPAALLAWYRLEMQEASVLQD